MLQDLELNMYHARFNPYPTYAGFGLRVYRAKQAIERLSRDRYADIYTRGFDNCFENGDGSAVVWALMHKAHAEPAGNAPLTRGIQIMFSTTLDEQKYPQCWLDTYNGKPPYGDILPVQPSLF